MYLVVFPLFKCRHVMAYRFACGIHFYPTMTLDCIARVRLLCRAATGTITSHWYRDSHLDVGDYAALFLRLCDILNAGKGCGLPRPCVGFPIHRHSAHRISVDFVLCCTIHKFISAVVTGFHSHLKGIGLAFFKSSRELLLSVKPLAGCVIISGRANANSVGCLLACRWLCHPNLDFLDCLPSVTTYGASVAIASIEMRLGSFIRHGDSTSLAFEIMGGAVPRPIGVCHMPQSRNAQF